MLGSDTIFLIAAALVLISLPRILVALAQNIIPRKWIITLGVCIIVILVLKWLHPGSYTFEHAINLVINVVAQII